MAKRPSMQMGANSRFLYQHLKTFAVDQQATFADLTAVIGAEVTSTSSALRTAMRALQRDDQMVFVNVRGVGIKRANNEEIADTAASVTRSIRKKASRGYATMMNADFATLPPKKQLDFTLRSSTLSAVAQITTERQIAKLGKAVSGSAKELSLSETIKAMLAK